VVPDNVIKRLIDIGNCSLNLDLDESQIKDLKIYDKINRLHWNEWYSIADKLNVMDLANLIRGLTIAEKIFNWTGGSVSAVIWTFRSLQNRDIELANTLADWILKKTNNPWVPFGTQNHGAKSLDEYSSLVKSHNAKINQRL